MSIVAPTAQTFDPRSIEGAKYWRTFTNFDSKIDLLAAGGGPCRAIRVKGAGTVTLVPVGLPAGSDAVEAINYLDGDLDMVEATEISAVSGPTAITVYW